MLLYITGFAMLEAFAILFCTAAIMSIPRDEDGQ